MQPSYRLEPTPLTTDSGCLDNVLSRVSLNHLWRRIRLPFQKISDWDFAKSNKTKLLEKWNKANITIPFFIIRFSRHEVSGSHCCKILNTRSPFLYLPGHILLMDRTAQFVCHILRRSGLTDWQVKGTKSLLEKQGREGWGACFIDMDIHSRVILNTFFRFSDAQQNPKKLFH